MNYEQRKNFQKDMLKVDELIAHWIFVFNLCQISKNSTAKMDKKRDQLIEIQNMIETLE